MTATIPRKARTRRRALRWLTLGAVAVLLAPAAGASTTIEGMTGARSAPVYNQDVTVPVDLGPGDRVTAVLTYLPQAGSDLDLTLYSPFHRPLAPLDPVIEGDIAGTIDIAVHWVAQRVDRATCRDALAASERHFGDGGHEAIDFTVPATALAGTHDLKVQTFTGVRATPFTLTVTVTAADDLDVTPERVGAAFAGQSVNAWAYCPAGMRSGL